MRPSVQPEALDRLSQGLWIASPRAFGSPLPGSLDHLSQGLGINPRVPLDRTTLGSRLQCQSIKSSNWGPTMARPSEPHLANFMKPHGPPQKGTPLEPNFPEVMIRGKEKWPGNGSPNGPAPSLVNSAKCVRVAISAWSGGLARGL